MNTPAVRLILRARGSDRNVSASPRIGSGGAATRASDGSDTGDLGVVGSRALRRYTDGHGLRVRGTGRDAAGRLGERADTNHSTRSARGGRDPDRAGERRRRRRGGPRTVGRPPRVGGEGGGRR